MDMSEPCPLPGPGGSGEDESGPTQLLASGETDGYTIHNNDVTTLLGMPFRCCGTVYRHF